MKKISNFSNDELRAEQFANLIEIIGQAKSRGKLQLFLQAFLTRSEAAYLGQRLNIMQLLAKRYHYSEIKDMLHVPNATITRTHESLLSGGEEFEKLIKHCKHIPTAKHKEVPTEISQATSFDNAPGFFRASLPGAIRRTKNYRKRK